MTPRPIRPPFPVTSLAGLSLAIALLLLALPACGGKAGIGEPTARSVYKEVTKALDDAYAELGKPAPTSENLLQVQKQAYEKLLPRVKEWPTGTTFSLSGLQGKVRITVRCGEEEKIDDWEP